ncbi:hypothetical protein C7S18_15505 [Ahniella affigens]|uniref:DUF3379 domain-containing protein n=1 Tax=Ahniella affigens TaxID=2021234 RepID=A0A2P1PUI9_9GAMM|nr:DUF3379 family protein [Ahniella affigens]AVP98504.1 hypothetical protein C7S18_15505 [Ahniella affigens]
MNCLEFRRELAASPQVMSAAAREHRGHCSTCADAWHRAQLFEQRLQSVLAVPVPMGLADRILLRQTTDSRVHRQSARQTWIRLAAGLMMTAGMVGVGYLTFGTSASLASASMAHLSHEPFALNRTELIPAATVSQLFAESGVYLKAPLQSITYLTRCPVYGQKTIHMVIRDGGQPITAIYVPNNQQGSADFAERQIVGRHRNIGHGTLVLMAEHGDAFDRIEASFRAAIEGSSSLAGMY